MWSSSSFPLLGSGVKRRDACVSVSMLDWRVRVRRTRAEIWDWRDLGAVSDVSMGYEEFRALGGEVVEVCVVLWLRRGWDVVGSVGVVGDETRLRGDLKGLERVRVGGLGLRRLEAGAESVIGRGRSV